MKFIKVTSDKNDDNIFINVDMIGHIYNDSNYITTIGVATHNNGGFKVSETIEEVLELIKQLN